MRLPGWYAPLFLFDCMGEIEKAPNPAEGDGVPYAQSFPSQ